MQICTQTTSPIVEECTHVHAHRLRRPLPLSLLRLILHIFLCEFLNLVEKLFIPLLRSLKWELQDGYSVQMKTSFIIFDGATLKQKKVTPLPCEDHAALGSWLMPDCIWPTQETWNDSCLRVDCQEAVAWYTPLQAQILSLLATCQGFCTTVFPVLFSLPYSCFSRSLLSSEGDYCQKQGKLF